MASKSNLPGLPMEVVMFMIIVVLLSLTLPSFSSSSSSSSSTGTMKNIGFTAPLIHRIYSPRSPFYNPNLTDLDRIQASIDQSYSWYHHHHHQYKKIKSKSTRSSFTNNEDDYPDWIEVPVRPVHDHFGSAYLLSYKIGTPPIVTFADIDTGSSLTWLQCLPCEDCFLQKTPIYDPEKSSTYAKLKCNDSMISNCAASEYPHIGKCDFEHYDKTCIYYSHYLDGSYTKGNLATETLIFESDDRPRGTIMLPKIAFGCGHENVFKYVMTSPGMIGLDRGELSFVSQIRTTGFSYCLLPMNNIQERETSKMHFGAAALIVGGKTPMITSPKNALRSYYINLEGISVGNERLSIPAGTFNITPEGEGGFVVDSGTTFTFLNSKALLPLAESIKKKTTITDIGHSLYNFPLCYWCTADDIEKLTPNVTFHFDGVDLELSKENTWVEIKYSLFWSKMWCLAMHPTEDISILGNRQQQNVNIGHDLQNNVISFKPMDCTKT